MSALEQVSLHHLDQRQHTIEVAPVVLKSNLYLSERLAFNVRLTLERICERDVEHFGF